MRHAVIVLATALVLLAPAASADHVTRHEFAWRATAGVEAVDGYLREGQGVEHAATLPKNLTRVVVRLTWQDDAGGPDAFNLAADGPAGPRQQSGSSGAIEIVYDLGTPPSGGWSVDAASPEEARARSEAERPGDATYAGPWLVAVRLLEAGDGGLAFFPEADEGNRYRLEIAWDAYEATAVAATTLDHEGSTPDAAVGPPGGRAPVVPPEPSIGIGFLAFAGVGVVLWALVARWRRNGQL